MCREMNLLKLPLAPWGLHAVPQLEDYSFHGAQPAFLLIVSVIHARL